MGLGAVFFDRIDRDRRTQAAGDVQRQPADNAFKQSGPESVAGAGGVGSAFRLGGRDVVRGIFGFDTAALAAQGGDQNFGSGKNFGFPYPGFGDDHIQFVIVADQGF